MLRISQLTLPVDHTEEEMLKKAAKLLRVRESEIRKIHLVRRSVDARKKDHLVFSYIVDVELNSKNKENSFLRKNSNTNIRLSEEKRFTLPERGETPLKTRPVIIGAGPAGLYAGLSLASKGYAPLILEQGDEVDKRAEKVLKFWREGSEGLDIRSNVQFGEGGAGTFSDGKLNTLVKDLSGRNHEVLRIFVESGADSSILYDHLPHIGTDVLRTVVKNLRNRIQEAGGEVRFLSEVTDLTIKDGKITGLTVNGTEKIDADVVIIAAGHSARSLFHILEEKQVEMEAKPFAVGLRVQHPQKMMNELQYGNTHSEILGPAPYKVTARTSEGRGVYSFCMCPGGYVVNASSEKGMLAVNGMSYHGRDSESANSAIIVTVDPEDFEGSGPLRGIEFQRKLEKRAFELGCGKIPVQLYEDFKNKRISHDFGDVVPCFKGETAFADLTKLLPSHLASAFTEGMEQFGRRMKGFDRPDAILAGIESRTSSPVRITRGETMESNIGGIYPCGEGAGYAGGITSAAMDGIRIAEAVISRFYPDYD